MKKKVLSAAVLLVSAVLLCSCGKENVLSVKEKNIRIKVEEKYTVKVDQKKEEPLKWESANQSVAVVSPDGTVTAMGKGITTVTASGENTYVHVGVIVDSDDGYVDKDGNVVHVFNEESDITEISVGVRGGGRDDVTVKAGDTITLRAYVTPSDSKDKIVWKSADSAIAKVDENGVVKVLRKGQTTISAYAPNGINGQLILRVN